MEKNYFWLLENLEISKVFDHRVIFQDIMIYWFSAYFLA